jgi:hypothetical protein
MVPAATAKYRGWVGLWPAVGIANAAAVTPPGNVILVEVQMSNFSDNGCYFCINGSLCDVHMPVEYYPGEHAAIRSATQSGIVVVEAAGNAQKNLDWWPALQRTPPDPASFSGAVMVGGVMNGVGRDGDHPTACSGFNIGIGSNAGSRLDLSAWYQVVDTLGFGLIPMGGTLPSRFNTTDPGDARQHYTDQFNGTSSASAIVAGSLVSLIGMYKAHNGPSATAPAPAEFLARTGRAQILVAGEGPRVGPTVQPGMAATAFRDRIVGDTDPTTFLHVVSANDVRGRLLVTARRTNGAIAYNMLRGGGWYGWTDLPWWLGAPVTDDARTLTLSTTTPQVDAFHVDAAGRLVVARMSSIDPPSSSGGGFSAWSLASSSDPGGIVSVTPVAMMDGYEDVFARTTTGGLRWYYRSNGATQFVYTSVSVPSPIFVSSAVKGVVTAPNRVDLYTQDPSGTIYRATSVSGGAFVGWTAVPGATGVTHFDVARVDDRTVLIAAAWSGGTTTFLHDVVDNTETHIYPDLTPSTELVLASGLVEGRARLLTRRLDGTMDARAVFDGSMLITGASHAWNSSATNGHAVTARWQNATSIAITTGQDGLPRFRVVDGLYPKP